MHPAALAFIQRFEGLHDGDKRTPLLEPLRDPIGIWTLGWGAIFDAAGRRVTEHTPAITRAEADALLARDFGAAVAGVVRLSLPRVLLEGERIALGSFAYNLGLGAYRASTLRRRVIEGDDEGAAREFPKWNKAGGRVLPGLVKRRAAEAALFLRGSQALSNGNSVGAAA